MANALKSEHTDLCVALCEFKYYSNWLANSKNITSSAEDFCISVSRLGERLREVGEWVLAERADDFLNLCRRVLMEHMALNDDLYASDSCEGEDDSMSGDSNWSSKLLVTTKHRFNAQLDELRENMCLYELHAFKCAGCDGAIQHDLERRAQSSRKYIC